MVGAKHIFGTKIFRCLMKSIFLDSTQVFESSCSSDSVQQGNLNNLAVGTVF